MNLIYPFLYVLSAVVPLTGDEGMKSAVLFGCIGGGLVVLLLLLTIIQKMRRK